MVVACMVSSCRNQKSTDTPTGSIRLVEDLVIGSAEGDDAYLFASIPGIAIANDGRIALVDSQDPRIRVFEADGTFSHYAGKQGSGPGELRMVISLTSLGDKIAAADEMRQRFVVYSWEGEFLFGKPFPVVPLHPYRTRGVGDQIFVAATTTESDSDGSEIPAWDAKYLRLLNGELDQTKRFGAMADIIDTSSDYEIRSANFTSVAFSANDERVLVAPQTWGCKAAVYEWQDTAPRPSILVSPECPDKGYRSMTEAEFNDLRSRYADNVDQMPGSIGASFGPDGRHYSLSWRRVDGVHQREDGSMLILVKKWDDGWQFVAELFSAEGEYVGSFPIVGMPDFQKSSFAAVDRQGNFYFRKNLEGGVPAVVRYRVEYDLSRL